MIKKRVKSKNVRKTRKAVRQPVSTEVRRDVAVDESGEVST